MAIKRTKPTTTITPSRPPSHRQSLPPSPGRVFLEADLPLKGIRISPTHLRRLMDRGEFPRPFYLTAKKPAWPEKVLDEWLAARMAAA